MAKQGERIKIKLNSVVKVEDVLQETYDYSCKLINEIQLEMNKLSSAYDLVNCTPDEKVKYSKAMHDFLNDKAKAISIRMDIVRFMGEVLKFKGDTVKAVDETEMMGPTSLDLEKLKQMVSEGAADKDVDTSGKPTKQNTQGYRLK